MPPTPHKFLISPPFLPPTLQSKLKKMAQRFHHLLPSLLAILLIKGSKGDNPITFTLINNCDHPVWPGILSGAGTAPLDSTGFALNKGETRTLSAPTNWSGRMWGRTLCSTDPTTNAFTCGTGDCGSGTPECSGGGAAPPATLAEFTLAGSGGDDFYDVSLVDGYNLPMVVVPQGGNCSVTGCLVELNGACPSDLKVVKASEGVACKSACEAFGTAEYCCSGEYGPGTCKPSSYSLFFKNACPRAYSYAYDDATSTFTCAAGGGYSITFCPSTTSQKAGETDPAAPGTAGGVPLINDTMVFLGGNDASAVTSPRAAPLLLLLAAASWLLLRLV